MKFVVFGLTISSSWGNGHATLWRGLCRALGTLGHQVVFFERDVPYYADTRDIGEIVGLRLSLYPSWEAVHGEALRELADADVSIVTSYCPDAVNAALLTTARCSATRVFYDLDTPVTLAALEAGRGPDWIGERGLEDFDLVLSFTGGRALTLLEERLRARRVAPLYGFADAELHQPAHQDERYRGSLSYLGTYSSDRQARLSRLFFDVAERLPAQRFVLGGAMYPEPWSLPGNVAYYAHVAPAEHGAFFCSSRMTLNVTRDTMAELGYCPSGRLFEASSSGAPIVSDWFDGIELFFEPGREILIARDTEDVLSALARGPEELSLLARRARERTLAEHSAERRARELLRLVERAGGAIESGRASAALEGAMEV